MDDAEGAHWGTGQPSDRGPRHGGALPAPARPRPIEHGEARPIGRTVLHAPDGTAEATVFDRASLPVGTCLQGPAIVTQLDATTLVRPDWTAEVLTGGDRQFLA